MSERASKDGGGGGKRSVGAVALRGSARKAARRVPQGDGSKMGRLLLCSAATNLGLGR